MRKRSQVILALLALAAAMPLAGCGDGSNDNIFIGDATPTPTPAGGRTSTPVRTATPEPGATATLTAAAATPTATDVAGPTTTPTPSGPACVAGDKIIVTESLDKPYGGARVDLLYPTSVSIPGTGTDPSVGQRVVFTPTGGLATTNDQRVNGAFDDTLTASFAGFNPNAAGTFVTITFDCTVGEAPPTVGAFTCTVVSATAPNGATISDEQCALTVTGP